MGKIVEIGFLLIINIGILLGMLSQVIIIPHLVFLIYMIFILIWICYTFYTCEEIDNYR